MRRRRGIPHWCFWRVATTILWVFSGLSNIAFAEHHSVTSWMQHSIYSSYIISRSRKGLIISKHVTINFSRWNTQWEIIYVNTEEKSSKKKKKKRDDNFKISQNPTNGGEGVIMMIKIILRYTMNNEVFKWQYCIEIYIYMLQAIREVRHFMKCLKMSGSSWSGEKL